MRANGVAGACMYVSVMLNVSLATAMEPVIMQHKRLPYKVVKPRIQDSATGNSYRLDWCYNSAKNCGKMAANEYCRSSTVFAVPYEKATKWEMDPDIGARTPTWVMGDHKVCDQSFCDGFAYITCSD